MENVCAFVTVDNICLKPPTGWAKQYEKLLKIAWIKNPSKTKKAEKLPKELIGFYIQLNF